MTETPTNPKGTPSRIIGLDLIRVVAIFSVVAGHFWDIHTPFKESVFNSLSMSWQSAVYFLVYATGVPLFIMMTGYLNANKVECTRKYYGSGMRVILAYLFFSLLTLSFRTFWLGENLSWVNWGSQILRFNAIQYAWYIEMWIGLFIFTPFLNLMYKAIPSKRQKQILLITLFIMTAFPSFFNRFGYHLVPGFWASVFPLTFFFIGSYIREYEPRLTGKKIWVAIIAIILICAINPVFNMLFVQNQAMIPIAGYSQGIFGTIVAVLIFLLLYKVDIKNHVTTAVLKRISLLSLDMYLCCWIFDKLFYPYFLDRYFVNQSQFGKYFFVIVPLVFFSSLIVAQLKEWLFALGGRLLGLKKA